MADTPGRLIAREAPDARHSLARWSATAARVGGALQRVEWLLLGAAAPTLIFPSRFTWVGVGLIASTWLARRAGTGRWSVKTRVHRPALVLIAALLLSLVPSIRLDYSLPKFLGIALGLAALYACLNLPRSPCVVRRAECLLLVAGAAIAVLGIVGMSKPPNKLVDERIYAVLPRLVTSVQSSTIVSQGIQPNELAGTLVLLIPLSAALCARRDRLLWLAAVACGLMLAAVVLSQSRAGLLGLATAAGIGTLTWCGSRRGVTRSRVALVVVGCVLLGIAGTVGLGQLQHARSSATNLESLPGRIELWQRGLAMALDMPLTGIGLNTFPIVLQTFYPTIFDSQFSLIPHAHDLYLQTLLDLGLPGLAAFLAIASTAVAAGVRVALRSAGNRHLAAGLLLGLLAHAAFSVVDAVALGAKPGLLLWLLLGLLLVVGDDARAASSPRTRARQSPRPLSPRQRWPLQRLAWPPQMRLRLPMSRQMTWAVCGLLLTPLWLGAAGLNAANVLLHRSEATDSPVLVADLQLARLLTLDPLFARVAAAQSLQAERRGDLPAAIAALNEARQRGGWDPSLALRLGNLRAAAGDRDGAVEAWRSAHAVDPLLARANASPPEERLQWLSIASAVDPTDSRPYVRAASILEYSDPHQAAAYIASALNARGDEPVRREVANRLTDPLAPLPSQRSAPASPQDASLFMSASRLLLTRGDLPGGVVSAQLATLSAPELESTWTALANALDKAGSPVAAERARAQAALVHQ